MEKGLKTPYFLIKEELLQHDFDMLASSLKKEWNNYVIGYSFKTNSLPWLVTFLKAQGVYAEVVSEDEYSLAKYLGYTDDKIIYNGPYKERTSFEKVLCEGGIVNIDTKQELEWLEQISTGASSRRFEIGVRVNFDLEKCCPGETTMGTTSGRFGFCYETGVLGKVIRQIEEMPNVSITGFHLHSSSKTRSLKIFEAISGMACKLKRKYNLKLKYIDLGGGYCGGLENRPQYPEYCEVIGKELKKEFKPSETAIILEPGISLVSRATTFVTSVIDSRDIKGNRYLITDGSRFNIDTTMIKKSYLFHINYNPDYSKKRDVLAKQMITGFTCIESDRLFELGNSKELVYGDQIVYENVGGYTMSMNPLFIQYFPVVYLEKDGELLEIRGKWTAKEYVQKCKYN